MLAITMQFPTARRIFVAVTWRP